MLFRSEDERLAAEAAKQKEDERLAAEAAKQKEDERKREEAEQAERKRKEAEEKSSSEPEAERKEKEEAVALSQQKSQEKELDGYLYENDKEELRFIAEQLDCSFQEEELFTIDAVKKMMNEAEKIDKECKTKIKSLKGQSKKVKRTKEDAKAIEKKMIVFQNRLSVFASKIEMRNENIVAEDWKDQFDLLNFMKEVRNWDSASEAEEEDEEDEIEEDEDEEDGTVADDEAISVWDKYKDYKNIGGTLTKVALKSKLQGDNENFVPKQSILDECGKVYRVEQKTLKSTDDEAEIIKKWITQWNKYIEKSKIENANDLGVGNLDDEFGKVDWFLFYKEKELVGAFNVSGLTSRKPELYLLLTKIEDDEPVKMRNLGTFKIGRAHV